MLRRRPRADLFLAALRSRAFLVHAAAIAALTAWSWRKWPDPLLDFGRELYVPWQITTGQVLYRDIAPLFGPLSQYLNAFWFALFGDSLTTIVASNLAILCATACGIYRLVSRCCDSGTATACTLMFLVMFGFPQYVWTGNYNFISPYAHEATHSFALAVAFVLALESGLRTRRSRWMALAGLLLGLVLLTKPETAMAVLATAAVALVAAALLTSEDRTFVLKAMPRIAAAALVAPVAFFAYFSLHMPAAAAARAAAGSWAALLTTSVAANRFYLLGAGLEEPVANGVRALTVFAGVLAVGVAAAVLDRRWPGHLSTVQYLVWRVGRIALLVVAFLFAPWTEVPAALPLIAAAACAVFAVMFLRRRPDRDASIAILPLLMWATFSLAMLAKMILNARFYHYGFFLAAPATVLLVMLMLSLIPGWLRDKGAQGRTFATIAGLLLIAMVGAYGSLAVRVYRLKDYPIGSGGDRFYAFGPQSRWQGEAVRRAVEYVQQSVPPSATMAVIPEGVMINYLTRRPNPTPYINLMPPEVSAFGEDRILKALEAARPDYVLLVSRDMAEYGFRPFGTDPRYLSRVVDWVEENYRTLHLIGPKPVRAGGPAIEIMARRPPGKSDRDEF